MGEAPCYAHLLDDEGRMPERRVRIRRAYDTPGLDEGQRVLVDRVWPRGLSRERVGADLWMRDLAPSPELRRWFGHRPERWEEFRRRYREELETPERQAELDRLERLAREGGLTLLYGARDENRNQAVVIREALRERSER